MEYNQGYRDVTRKAILIACPGDSRNFLRGPKADMSAMRSFLQSEFGGKWRYSEITVLNNPSADEVWHNVERAYEDYVFVYFSGHGCTDDFGNRMISLRDMLVPDKFLLSYSPRQVVVVDACGNYASQGLSGLPDFGDQLNYFEGAPVRQIFDEFIQTSPNGKLIIHAADRGYFAGDTARGGVFTHALLNSSCNMYADAEYNFYSINTVLQTLPSELHRTQQPCISFAEGNLVIPFAVGVPNSRKRTRHPMVTRRSNLAEAVGVGILGALALGLLVSASK